MPCGIPVIDSDIMLRGLLDVNDNNFGNGRMLVVNSNCDHEYIDPATFFQTLLPNTFLDLTDTPNNYSGFSGRIVRVNSTGDGLEFIDPTTMDYGVDELVAAESGATPGYLGNVLSVVPGELTKTVSGNNVILGLSSTILNNISTNFLALTDTENSYTGHKGQAPIVNDSETGLEFKDVYGKNLRCRIFLTNDFSVSQAINTADDTFVITDMPGVDGNVAMKSTFGGADSIKILETGCYRVTVRGNIGLSPGVLAARVFAVSTPPTAIGPICDTKIGSRDSGNGHGAYQYDMVVSYGQSMIYKFEKGTEIYTGGIISTNVGNIGTVTTGTIDILRGNIRGAGTDDRGHSLEVSRVSPDYV